ncbi:hypothetical protein [Gracilibacillus xinjiangensis]|uniref:Uncharacterized protein n=1 Tax=Gracilibacillus xinjiangensis TaxID=1193282 RepID=A0ABV8WW76_9BACI
MSNWTAIDWKQKVDDYKRYLKEEEWFASGAYEWQDLPEGVRRAIVRGISAFREDIEKFEGHAKEIVGKEKKDK